VWYNKIYACVPYPDVRDAISQIDFLGSRGKWVEKIHEYTYISTQENCQRLGLGGNVDLKQ